MPRAKYKKLLRTVAADLKSVDGALQPPISVKELRRLQQAVVQDLACELPEAYADFLRVTNGFSWSGIHLSASSRTPIVGHADRFIAGIVEANQTFRQNSAALRDYLILGDDGDALFAYHVSEHRYELFTALMSPLEEFATFDEMICQLIEEQL